MATGRGPWISGRVAGKLFTMPTRKAAKSLSKRKSAKPALKSPPAKRKTNSASAKRAPIKGRLAAKPSAKKASAPRLARRERYPMPADVKRALTSSKLLDAYRARPPYQQNDYIGWITQAKRESTRAKRVEQMLSELKRGNLYMKMKWSGTTA